ncbi:MAG: hypothetical protein QW086_05515 [Pyrobaculum sp.]
MKRNVSKTTVPVDSEVAKEVSSVAKTQGFSVVKLASDSLKLAVELLRRGITPTKALEMFRLAEKILAFDVVPVPLSYLELVARKWKTCEDQEVEQFLRETGEKFGKVVAAEYRTFGEFMATASQFFSMFPVARLSFSRSGNTWRIVFTSTGELSVKCLGYFAEEAIKQFGCSVKTSYEGNIIIAELTC